MKIVVLNECFLSPSQLDQLRSYGDLAVHNDTTTEEAALERIKGADIILADMFECPLNANVLGASSGKLLCINSTSCDLVDLETARKKGITVCDTPGLGTEAVAEHSILLLLAAARRFHLMHNEIEKKGFFHIDPASLEHRKFLGTTLSGKTIGIIGLGAIGSHVAKIAQGFGMKIIAYNRSAKTLPSIEMTSLDDLLGRADVVSVHTALTLETKHIINDRTIARMKKGSILVSTAGRECVDSPAVLKALESSHLAAAALDILGLDNNALLRHPHAVVTPHAAWYTRETLDNIGRIMTETVLSFVKGVPINVVS